MKREERLFVEESKSCIRQAKRPGNAINYRISIMKAQGAHLEAIKAMRSGTLDMPRHHNAVHAEAVKTLTEMLMDLFPKGSYNHAASRARKEIWQNWEEFKKLVEATKEASAKLEAASRNGNNQAMKTGLRTSARVVRLATTGSGNRCSPVVSVSCV